jgi:hypothetical protein
MQPWRLRLTRRFIASEAAAFIAAPMCRRPIATHPLLSAVLACGSGAGLFEAASASAQDPAHPKVRSDGPRSGAQGATFKVPALWEYSPPLIAPEMRETNPSRAQKDPSVVFYGGQWHVFMTVKLPGKSAIEYCSFKQWAEAKASPRTLLKVSASDYFCAPQVFYFRPHKKWHLVYQVGVPGLNRMWVAYSTNRS